MQTEEELAAEKEQEERNKQLEDAEAKAQAAEEAKIKAEAKLEAFQSAMTHVQQTGQAPAWSEEQWASFEQETGISKKQLVTHAQITQQQIDAASRKLEEKLNQAEERARRAEEKAGALESDRKAESVKQKFYKEKPALSRYDAEIDEFLADYPEADRRDPEKLKKLLGKAEIYVKGKVGEKQMKLDETNRQKFGRGEESEPEAEPIDFSGMSGSESATLKQIVPDSEREKMLRDVASNARPGIALEGDREWKQAKEASIKQFGKW